MKTLVIAEHDNASLKGATLNTISAATFSCGYNVSCNGSNDGSINLTVTGAFDREGTARTIVETLNDSYYRGTGGAGSLQIA